MLRCMEGGKEVKLTYTVEIDEEIFGLDGLNELLNETISNDIGCSVIKSRLESLDEINEIGEWEDTEDE